MNRYMSDDDLLDRLQCDRLRYFLDEANPKDGLVPDSSHPGAPSSITPIGFALAAYVVAVERNVITRSEAIDRTLATLRFLGSSPQTRAEDATGYRGTTGIESELSTIDATFLIAGALTAAACFDRDSSDEGEIRALADAPYRRVDWQWAQNDGLAVSHGWTPERGFLRYRCEGYSEALLWYVLGLGSPTHPLPAANYSAWTKTYRCKKLYGYEFLYGGPLFIHQLSHVRIDFLGIQDEYMRDRGSTIPKTAAGRRWCSSSMRSATRGVSPLYRPLLASLPTTAPEA